MFKIKKTLRRGFFGRKPWETRLSVSKCLSRETLRKGDFLTVSLGRVVVETLRKWGFKDSTHFLFYDVEI